MSHPRRNGPARLLVLDKPAGPTSFEMVARVRRESGYRKVGHAGTLDPFASGVLVLGLGPATRLLGYLSAGEKRYRMRVEFGRATDSHDSTGVTTSEAEPRFTRQELESALDGFRGRIRQVPPTLSAIRIEGRRAYELHRRGEPPVEMPAREVVIHSLELVAFEAPQAELLVRCGGGTYMRSLARDLGRQLDCPAHAATLRREAVGCFELADAVRPDSLEEACSQETIGLDPADLVRDWRRIRLDEEEIVAVRHGRQPPAIWIERALPGDAQAPVALLDPDGHLAAIAEADDASLRLAMVMPTEESG